jgi:transcriptional regulator with XRE-family HTH domain
MKSKKSMAEARAASGKTLEEVAAAAKISYSAARALEKGIGRNYAPAIKHRISDFLGVPFFSMWPEEQERLQGIFEEVSREDRERLHLLLTLKDYQRTLRFASDSAAATLLNAMSLDELDGIFRSGVSRDDVIDALRAAAKLHKLPMPGIK